MRKAKSVANKVDTAVGQMSLFPEETKSSKPASPQKRKRGTGTRTGKTTATNAYGETMFPVNKPVTESKSDASDATETSSTAEPAKLKKRRKQKTSVKKDQTENKETENQSNKEENTTFLHWNTGRPGSLGQYLCQAHGMYVLLMYFPEGPKDGTQTEPGWYGNYPGEITVNWHFVKETEITRWAALPKT